MIYYEHRNGLMRNSPPTLLPKEEAKYRLGFSSVFGYDEETAKYIMENNSLKGLSDRVLYCDELYLDFDTEEGIQAAKDFLATNKLRAQIYTTGNRGCHIHIQIVPLSGVGLADRLKQFVANVFPGADTGIYKATGIFRNIGTWHQKNPGHRKELIGLMAGDILSIPALNKTIPRFYAADQEDATDILNSLLLKKITTGERNNKMYNLAFLAKTSGMTVKDAEIILYNYNMTNVEPPLKSSEFRSIITSCFGRD